MKLKIKRLADVPLPAYAHQGDAGLDLTAKTGVFILPGTTKKVGTGIAVEIPPGYAGLVLPRSGLSMEGITLANCVGLIDSGYRGEISLPLHNMRPNGYQLEPGTRCAQLVIVPVAICELLEVDELSESARGSDGFGSTGW